MHDWLRSTSTEDVFNVEVYGNFVLKDSETKLLSASHGYRCLSDVALSSGVREEGDYSVLLQDTSDCRNLAASLVDGRATAHFAKIFKKSSNAILGLTQIVLCCDTLAKSSWQNKFLPMKIYPVGE